MSILNILKNKGRGYAALSFVFMLLIGALLYQKGVFGFFDGRGDLPVIYNATTTDRIMRDGYGGAIASDQYGRPIVTGTVAVSSVGTAANPIADIYAINGDFTALETDTLLINSVMSGDLDMAGYDILNVDNFYSGGTTTLATSSGRVGIGTTTPATKLQVLDTAEQLRLSYDAANYGSFTVSSGGELTIDATGSTTTISDNLSVSGMLNVIRTSEQLRLGYDASNYVDFLVASDGSMTITPTGATTTVEGDLVSDNIHIGKQEFDLNALMAEWFNVPMDSNASTTAMSGVAAKIGGYDSLYLGRYGDGTGTTTDMVYLGIGAEDQASTSTFGCFGVGDFDTTDGNAITYIYYDDGVQYTTTTNCYDLQATR